MKTIFGVSIILVKGALNKTMDEDTNINAHPLITLTHCNVK